METKRFVSWDWVFDQVKIISSKIPENITYISGIPRGGLIPAVILSHMSNIRFIDYSEVKFFKTEQKKNVLIIDDIADTGLTLDKKEFDDFLIATLCMRYTSIHKPEIYGEYIDDDKWIVFPWEKEDSDEIQDYLK